MEIHGVGRGYGTAIDFVLSMYENPDSVSSTPQNKSIGTLSISALKNKQKLAYEKLGRLTFQSVYLLGWLFWDILLHISVWPQTLCKLTSNSWLSCLRLPSVGMIGVYHIHCVFLSSSLHSNRCFNKKHIFKSTSL